MPTINQLVRKGRRMKKGKDKSPALRFSFNTLKNAGFRNTGSHKNEEYALKLELKHQKNLTQH